MHLVPFEQLDDLPFSLTAEAVRARLGTPRRAGRNNVELDEMDYGGVVFRFQDNGRLEEISCRAPVLHLGTVAVPFAHLPAFVRAQDAAVFERAGFLVSPRYGLAFVPGNEGAWITALARHCLPQWEALRPH